jgi:hypothetical protein
MHSTAGLLDLPWLRSGRPLRQHRPWAVESLRHPLQFLRGLRLADSRSHAQVATEGRRVMIELGAVNSVAGPIVTAMAEVGSVLSTPAAVVVLVVAGVLAYILEPDPYTHSWCRRVRHIRTRLWLHSVRRFDKRSSANDRRMEYRGGRFVRIPTRES